MKKFLFLILLAAFSFASQAQVAQVRPTALTTTSYSNALDTVTNTATKVTTPFRVSSFKSGVTAQVVVTKISGTVGGTLALQGSMDGTNWSTIGNAATPSDGTANYSFNTAVAWYY